MRQTEKGRERPGRQRGRVRLAGLGVEVGVGVREGGVCVRRFMMKNEGCSACAWRRL